MERIELTNNFTVSRVIHGHWRLMDWGLHTAQLNNFINKILELGITTFDHADIYGNYECEQTFGKVLALNKELRENVQIISKCGIKLISDKYPERKVKTYDYSYQHIIQSVENSLKNLQTDYLDLLLLHRPSPLINPAEVNKAFNDLKSSGKVLHFGVSNFTPLQFEMLQEHLNIELITNQIEISPYTISAFENGNIEFLLKNKTHPMAWSPLAGGNIFNPQDKKGNRILNELETIRKELNEDQIDKVIYAWLLKHPVGIIPIVGSGKIERISMAVDALETIMTDEQWFRIYIASKGEELP
jgi:predicted oxidoreductase